MNTISPINTAKFNSITVPMNINGIATIVLNSFIDSDAVCDSNNGFIIYLLMRV